MTGQDATAAHRKVHANLEVADYLTRKRRSVSGLHLGSWGHRRGFPFRKKFWSPLNINVCYVMLRITSFVLKWNNKTKHISVQINFIRIHRQGLIKKCAVCRSSSLKSHSIVDTVYMNQTSFQSQNELTWIQFSYFVVFFTFITCIFLTSSILHPLIPSDELFFFLRGIP